MKTAAKEERERLEALIAQRSTFIERNPHLRRAALNRGVGSFDDAIRRTRGRIAALTAKEEQGG